MEPHDHTHDQPRRATDPGAVRLGLGIGAGPRLAIWLAACAVLWLAVLWAGASTP